MTDDKEGLERRAHKRFKVKSGVTAAVIEPVNGKDYIYLGEILNISKGGLAFQYADRNGEPKEPYELDILVIKDIVRFTYFSRIRFKTVWISNLDVELSSDHLKHKQIGIQFEEMTPHQISQLDIFFQKYAIP